MDNNSFVPSLLTEKVKLSPKYMNKSFSQKLLTHLIEKNEGKCSKHGYIKKNSISITKISTGYIEAHSLHGFLNYHVQFKALVCNPTNGSIIKCKVINSNNFGVLCSSGIIDENNEYKAIMDIIVPKNSLNIRSDSNIDFNKIVPNQLLDVEIVGKKFEINDQKISAVGKIVKLENNTAFVDVEVNYDDDEYPEIEDTFEDEIIQESDIISLKSKGYLSKKNDDDDDDDDDDEDDDDIDVEPDDDQGNEISVNNEEEEENDDDDGEADEEEDEEDEEDVDLDAM
jgi:DNA-directed RNA polymerase subunit E'/Rpb7